METAFLRMWDVPISLIFCSSCIVMLPGICCLYFSSPFFSSPRVILSLPELLRLLPLHSFNFDFKVSIFWQFSSYFNWSVLLSGDGHINEQAAFFVSVFLITMSGLLALSHNLSALEYPTRLWCCLFLLAFGAHARTISRFLFIFISFVAIGYLNYVPHIRQYSRISGHILK